MSENHTVPVPSTALTVSDLSFSWPDGTPVFTGCRSPSTAARIRWSVPTAPGRPPLLRLIAGDLRPATGSVTTVGDVEFVAQNPQADPTRTVADVLAITPIFAALSRGRPDRSILPTSRSSATTGTSRSAPARCSPNPVCRMRIYSGPSTPVRWRGHTADDLRSTAAPAVGAAARRTHQQSRFRSRASLFRMIDQFSGVLLVVTHDLELLERVEATLELHDGSIRLFGGPYSMYREILDAEHEAALAAVGDARSDLAKQKREKEEANIKLARRERTARKAEREKRAPKIIRAWAERAEIAAGKLAGRHRDDVIAADRLQEARDGVRADASARIALLR